MKIVELSVILPVRNVGASISEILQYVSVQTKNINFEIIVVDMGSTDNTVLKAIKFIKESKINGFVIQNGDSTVSAALNTGISKANGQYITFVFARRLYQNYLKVYLQTAVETSADIVYGSINEEESIAAQRRLISKSICQLSGADYIKYIINDKIFIDIAAILISSKFITEKQIRFNELCSFGYSEEFVFRCLLEADIISQAPFIITRNHAFELKRGKQRPVGNSIFQHVDANLRIFDIIKTNQRKNTELIDLFEQQKIPQTIMHEIDIILKEGTPYNSIRGFLRVLGYDKLLVTGKMTNKKLKRRIKIWRVIPWMYKPN